MAQRSRSKNSLQTTRTLIEGILGTLGIANKIEQHHIWSVWEEAVGKQIAQHAVPARIRNNVLEIKVAHPVWMQQLQLLKPRLLKQINAHLGDYPINDLYLRRGQVKKEVAIQIQPAIDLPDLDENEICTIQRITNSVKDDEVRQSLESLFQKQLRRDKHNREVGKR